MRRRIIISGSTGIALVAVAAAVFAGSSPAAGASATTSESAIRVVENNVASELGDNAPTGVEHTVGTRAQEVLASSGAVLSDTTPSVLVVMHGHFTDANARRPEGAPAPSGTVLTLVIDSATGQVTDLGLENSTPNIATVGTVTQDG